MSRRGRRPRGHAADGGAKEGGNGNGDGGDGNGGDSTADSEGTGNNLGWGQDKLSHEERKRRGHTATI